MYIIKIKGKAKIPDYIQIRDDDFTLIAYFRADNIERGMKQAGLIDYIENVVNIIDKIEYGKVEKI
ncbi:MAG: fructose-6-phosphate aldolase [Bacteroidota bacterium]|nr:fructose-6-phosphate aldolase [Bacteroidota bacterium]